MKCRFWRGRRARWGGSTHSSPTAAADVKRQLVHACLAGIAAIREVNPCARILTSEPLIHVVAETASEAHVEGAAEVSREPVRSVRHADGSW